MGGGTAVRAAAKVGGIGVVDHGIRGGISSVSPPAEHWVRNVSRPVTALISQGGKAGGSDVAAAVQRPSWELDEWEFAGVEEELLLDTGRPMPRVLFGGAPSLQEAKDATIELKDALEKAMTVVASIASDPNVWDAVMKNDELTEFLKTYKTNVDLGDQESPSRCTEVSDNESQFETGKSVNGFGDFLENIKQKVIEMVSNVSTYLQNLSGAFSAEIASDARPNPVDKTLGASFMALVVMVIMVVMLKRV